MNRFPERSLQAAEASISRRKFLQPQVCAPFRGGFRLEKLCQTV